MKSPEINKPYILQENNHLFVWQFIIWFFILSTISLIYWSYNIKLDEISYSSGEIFPKSDLTKIQHIDGGNIKEIFISDGEYITKGSPIISLDGETYKVRLQQQLISKNNFENRIKYMSEQFSIKNKLFKQGLNSKMDILSLKDQLSSLQSSLDETDEEISLLENKISRLVISAPVTGFVHNLKVFNPGEVIGKGQVLLEIVPENLNNIAVVKISPSEIGHIKINDPVTLKFNTYDFSKYGGLKEKLLSISATTFLDDDKKPYYKGTVSISQNYFNPDYKLPILPGMTLTAEIKTGEKSVLDYLLKPIYYSKSRAFTEK